MRLLFIDIETTGFDRKWDFIIEVAAILYNTEMDKEVAQFHQYIKPKKPISREITEITGITNEMVANAKSEDDVLRELISFIEFYNPDHFVGHNYDAFDGDFFKNKTSYYFLNWPTISSIDTLKLARQLKVPTTMVTPKGAPSYKQESIAGAYGIKYDAHSAIEDVKALIQIYKKMTANQQQPTDLKRRKLGF